MSDRLSAARAAAWHLRHGGVRQLRDHLTRRRVQPARRRSRIRRTKRGVAVDPWPLPDRAPRRDLRVGVILDPFSALAFGYEWQQVPLTPQDWPAQVAQAPLDLLFVESAWNGNDGAWQFHLTGPQAPRPALVGLLAHCRERGIPTVFWNKEDPAHFEDFVDTAALFDHVYTTDVHKVADYRARLGHDRVGVLGFAVQPAIHNPIRLDAGESAGDVAFAGTYFAHKYPQRRDQMDLLLGAAVDVSDARGIGFDIYSRFAGGDDKYGFPAPFAAHVVGSCDYPQMLTVYRDYKVFLNVNTVTDSPSMCARRIFEITACGTPVLTTPSAATEALFAPGELFTARDREEAADLIRALVRSPQLRDRSVHLAQRRIWAGHTVADRVATVLDGCGLAARVAARPTVTALVATNRPGNLDRVLRTVAAQVGVGVQLAICLHGIEVDHRGLRAHARDRGITDLILIDAPATETLGGCLNLLLDRAAGDWVAKMDDDDRYGAHYLSDQLYAAAYSDADVVGKHAHYMHVEAAGATLLRFADQEHRFTHRVMGPTIVTRRDLARETRFPELIRGEDTGFLERIVAGGGTIFSADRFNFVQIRTGSAGHTWQVSDAHLMASGDVQFFGIAESQVFF